MYEGKYFATLLRKTFSRLAPIKVGVVAPDSKVFSSLPEPACVLLGLRGNFVLLFITCVEVPDVSRHRELNGQPLRAFRRDPS